MFLYHVPKGCDKKRGKMYRDLVIFGGRNTDGKADAPEAEGIFRWKYDGNGRPLEMMRLDRDGKVYSSVKYSYGSGGQPAEESAFILQWIRLSCGSARHFRV